MKNIREPERETLSLQSHLVVRFLKFKDFLYGIGFLVIITFLMMLYLKPPPFLLGVIDVQRLIADQAQLLASRYPKGQVPQDHLRETLKEIKDTLESWAYSHKTVLIARGAVWGGQVPDHTETLINLLQQGRDQ